MEALGINLGFFVVQLFNFIIVAIVLSAWAYGPIVNLLEQRKQRIAQGLEDARIASEARANAEKEAQKIIARLAQMDLSTGKLTREQARQLNQTFTDLIAQGAVAVPARG